MAVTLRAVWQYDQIRLGQQCAPSLVIRLFSRDRHPIVMNRQLVQRSMLSRHIGGVDIVDQDLHVIAAFSKYSQGEFRDEVKAFGAPLVAQKRDLDFC